VTAPTLNTFKNRLDKFWENQEIVYEDFKADIALGSQVNLAEMEEEAESGIEELLDPAPENITRYH